MVVGVPTGKGLHRLYPFSDNTALKLTTGRWYTPSGRTIQRIAKNEEEQFQQAQNEADGTPDSAATDTTDRPTYHTDGGRAVRGGGGIVPDIVVRQDSLTAGEKAFATALGSKFPEYRDALTSYALALKNQKTITSEDFKVTPAMRAEVLTRLQARGAKLSDETFNGASTLIDQQLGYEVTRYVFGRGAEFRRRAQDDRQMQNALDLLKKAQTPKDLMGLAMAQAAGSSGRN